MNFVAAQCS